MVPAFALNSGHDRTALKAEFARFGVLSIPDILAADTAEWLHGLLRGREDWKQSIASGNSLVELDRPTRAAMSPQQKADLDNAVYGSARQQFQFRYETIRVPDDDAGQAASSDPLASFARWWSHGEPREFLRDILSLAEIDFADVQATAYSPGDFLTGHTDDVDGKGRLAAYVLNLTPKWAVEWGGMLAFHDEAANRVLALPPAFNRLNLFRVPRLHSVTEVTRIAPYRRYALTGWLRQGQP